MIHQRQQKPLSRHVNYTTNVTESRNFVTSRPERLPFKETAHTPGLLVLVLDSLAAGDLIFGPAWGARFRLPEQQKGEDTAVPATALPQAARTQARPVNKTLTLLHASDVLSYWGVDVGSSPHATQPLVIFLGGRPP